MSRVITGIYQDRTRVTRALEWLLRSDVTAEEIVVLVGVEGRQPSAHVRWLSDIARDDLDRGATLVTVRGEDDIAGTAREILVRTGAKALSESWSGPPRRPDANRPHREGTPRQVPSHRAGLALRGA